MIMLFMAGVFFVSCTSATIIRSSDPWVKDICWWWVEGYGDCL